MFDADGTVTLNLHKNSMTGERGSPQITISVTRKEKSIAIAYYNTFGGGIYIDKSKNGYWKWSVQSKRNVLKILEYFQHFPVHSSHRLKFYLIPHLYDCICLKAHHLTGPEKNNSALHKKWCNLVDKWKSYSKLFKVILQGRTKIRRFPLE